MQLMHETLKRRAVAVTLSMRAATDAAIAAFEIDWHTVDGGGDYELSGTIGWPDADRAISVQRVPEAWK